MDVCTLIKDRLGIEAVLPPGLSATTRFEPLDAEDGEMCIVAADGGRVTLGYLSQQEPGLIDFWDSGDFGSFKYCGHEDALNELMQEGREARKPYLLVHAYDYGSDGERCELSTAKWNLEGDSFLTPIHVLVPSNAAVREYRKTMEDEGVEAAEQGLNSYAQTVLDEYNRWLGGDVYVLAVETWDIKEGWIEAVERTAIGGHVGVYSAKQCLRKAMDPSVRAEADLSP